MVVLIVRGIAGPNVLKLSDGGRKDKPRGIDAARRSLQRVVRRKNVSLLNLPNQSNILEPEIGWIKLTLKLHRFVAQHSFGNCFGIQVICGVKNIPLNIRAWARHAFTDLSE